MALVSKDVPEFLDAKKKYTVKEQRQFHLQKVVIQACVDKIYLHLDGEIEIDLPLNPRRLVEGFLSFANTFKHQNRVASCPYTQCIKLGG